MGNKKRKRTCQGISKKTEKSGETGRCADKRDRKAGLMESSLKALKSSAPRI